MSTRARHLAALALTLVLAAPAAARAQGQAAAPQKQEAQGVMESIGYANAIRVGNTIHVSGAVSPGATMEAQVAGIYASLARTLAGFGATLGDVVKETVYTTDMEGLKAANVARRAAYGAHSPAATWVQISRLFMESAKVEIEVTAIIGSGTAAAKR
jgi:enamine deaminase RidA (YjgF/YER057c/UK114 family)